jgi:hypothetical protein
VTPVARKRRTAKTKPPASPGRRISIDDALRLLLTAYPPHAAAERLNAAWRDNTVRLWCNGKLLPPDFIRTELVVLARIEGDGRTRAEVVPARGAWEDKPYTFEVDEAEVMALLPSAPKRLPPGPRPRGNWPTLIRRELARMGRKRVEELRKSGELRDHLENFLEQKLKWVPQDPKALNAVIAGFLQG